MKNKKFLAIVTISLMLLLNGITCFAAHGENTLRPGESLSMWQWIESNNHEYMLQMQTDGKLILYSRNRGVLWVSPIDYVTGYNQRPDRCIMQLDGNLVIYHDLYPSKPNPDDDSIDRIDDFPVWHSNTHVNPGARLVLQDDGNLVIYKGFQPLWATGTNN